ncbi:MAG TPA: DUF4412 domain-containing protein [Polyangiaceae bacterium]|jgi:hypothetical protein|nr:DUF4412 domain-containing protein [Polyangiaceae bacterium]
MRLPIAACNLPAFRLAYRLSHAVGPALAALALAASGTACSKASPSSASTAAGGSSDGEGGTVAAANDSMPALEGFEGEIDVTIKGGKPTDAPTPLAVMVKSGKARVDIPDALAKSAGPMAANAKGYGIFDSAAKKVYIVLDPSKQVVVVDLNKIGEQAKAMNPGAGHAEKGGATPQTAPPKVTKTGKFDTVAGYKCENWEVTSDHHEGTACVASDGFSWLTLPMSALDGVPTEKLWMADLLDGKHFPLRFVGYEKDGTTESGRVEVTKIDKKVLPDAEFTYPPTYALVDLEQMIRGFAAMQGMMPGVAPGMAPPGMMPGRPFPGMPSGMPMPHKAPQ